MEVQIPTIWRGKLFWGKEWPIVKYRDQHPCVAAMWPCVKLLWPVVLSLFHSKLTYLMMPISAQTWIKVHLRWSATWSNWKTLSSSCSVVRTSSSDTSLLNKQTRQRQSRWHKCTTRPHHWRWEARQIFNSTCHGCIKCIMSYKLQRILDLHTLHGAENRQQFHGLFFQNNLDKPAPERLHYCWF